MTDLLPQSSAVLSECGLYRYSLMRRWAHGPKALFVMLNPSTADAMVDDPTIRRCIGFARREGLGGIVVSNLYAYRATDPLDMAKAVDPEGPAHGEYLRSAIEDVAGGPIIAAWGAHWMAEQQSDRVLDQLTQHDTVWCLGKTKAGAPRHPLYLPKTAPLEVFADRWRPYDVRH